MAHRLVFLTPGQQVPNGSTGVVLSNGGIVWIGEQFPTTAVLGTVLSGDITPETTYNNRASTQEEIDEYDYILANPSIPED